jgi:hypothetical protein
MSTPVTEPALLNQDFWHRQQAERNRALIALIRSWCEEDAAEDPQKLQAEWDELKRALDEDRLSDRKLFP